MKFTDFFCQIGSYFVSGCPGTVEFVPAFLLLPLSWDKGTLGQGNFFCPKTKGQQDKKLSLTRDGPGTSRPIPAMSQDSHGTSRPVGKPSTNVCSQSGLHFTAQQTNEFESNLHTTHNQTNNLSPLCLID